MAIAVEESQVDSVTTGDTLTLTSWTPDAYDLLLVFVSTRDDDSGIISSVTGNGLTWTLVKTLDRGSDHRISLYRAMGTAPTSGSVVVTLNSNTLPAVCVGVRISGADTSGSNGSGAVEVVKDQDSTNNDMKRSITTISENAFVFGFGGHRDGVFSVPSGEVSVTINNSIGAGSDETSASVWYEITTTAASLTIGDSNDLDISVGWALIAVSIKPSLIETTEVFETNYRIFTATIRKINFRNSAGDDIFSAYGTVTPITSTYAGNEISGIQVRNSVRAIIRKDIRQKVVQGDFMFLTPVHSFLVTSIKTFQNETEVVAIKEQNTPGIQPDIVKPFLISATVDETVIWQPVNAKRFRLVRVLMKITNAVNSNLTFRDGEAGSIILHGSTDYEYDSGVLGIGILSETSDNALTIHPDTSCGMVGHVLGFEE